MVNVALDSHYEAPEIVLIGTLEEMTNAVSRINSSQDSVFTGDTETSNPSS
jgi:hypothetical protein